MAPRPCGFARESFVRSPRKAAARIDWRASEQRRHGAERCFCARATASGLEGFESSDDAAPPRLPAQLARGAAAKAALVYLGEYGAALVACRLLGEHRRDEPLNAGISSRDRAETGYMSALHSSAKSTTTASWARYGRIPE